MFDLEFFVRPICLAADAALSRLRCGPDDTVTLRCPRFAKDQPAPSRYAIPLRSRTSRHFRVPAFADVRLTHVRALATMLLAHVRCSPALLPSRHGPNTHVASDAMLRIIAAREIVFAKGGSQKIPPAVSRVVR
jgi:hypothetical protein